MIITGSLFQAIQALGSAIYKALDYGLSSTEEPHLGPDLEEVIDYMIITGSLFQAIQALGSAIYKALDYGLSSTEEPHLGPDLEEVIDYYDHYWFSVSGNTSPRFSYI